MEWHFAKAGIDRIENGTASGWVIVIGRTEGDDIVHVTVTWTEHDEEVELGALVHCRGRNFDADLVRSATGRMVWEPAVREVMCEAGLPSAPVMHALAA